MGTGVVRNSGRLGKVPLVVAFTFILASIAIISFGHLTDRFTIDWPTVYSLAGLMLGVCGIESLLSVIIYQRLSQVETTLQVERKVFQSERCALQAERKALQAERAMLEAKETALDVRVTVSQSLVIIDELISELATHQQQTELLTDIILSEVIARQGQVNSPLRPINDAGKKKYVFGIELGGAGGPSFKVKIRAEDLGETQPDGIQIGSIVFVTGKLRREIDPKRKRPMPYFDAIYVGVIPEDELTNRPIVPDDLT